MKTVTICGVGALGSNYAFIARNFDVLFKFIDFDKVEIKNISNQFYTKQNIGKNKANALASNMFSNFGKKCEAFPHKLTKDNTEQLLGKSDLIVDCFDNYESREMIRAWVRKNNVACLHGALAMDGKYGVSHWDEVFEIDIPKIKNAPTCQNNDHTDFIVAVSSYLVTSTKRFLELGKKINFDVYPSGARIT